MTDGSRGSHARVDDARIECPARHVDVVSTLGAGDAFAATLSAGLLAHGDAERALREATYNASCVVQVLGAKRGLADRASIRRRAGRAGHAPDGAARLGYDPDLIQSGVRLGALHPDLLLLRVDRVEEVAGPLALVGLGPEMSVEEGEDGRVQQLALAIGVGGRVDRGDRGRKPPGPRWDGSRSRDHRERR